jgi:hypothetical protein
MSSWLQPWLWLSSLRQPLIGALLLVSLLLAGAAPSWAGPVDWQEVEPSRAGRQWWDAGSLRPGPGGRLSVLSRFQPADDPDGTSERSPIGRLYVMDLDCGQELFRDTAINGLPRWGAPWQAAATDDLTTRVLRAACNAATLAGSSSDAKG